MISLIDFDLSEEVVIVDEEIRIATENLNDKVRLLHISVKKMNIVAATLKAHQCKKERGMCKDLGILINGVIPRQGEQHG